MPSAAAGTTACSVFFKIKTGARFVWRGMGEGHNTALLVSVVSIGSMKVIASDVRVLVGQAHHRPGS